MVSNGESRGVVDVIAVELVAKRCGEVEHHLLDVLDDFDAPSRNNASLAQGTPERCQHQWSGETTKGDCHESLLQRRGSREFYRSLADVGVGVGIQHDREESVRNLAAVDLHRKVRELAVVIHEPCLQRRICKQWLTNETFETEGSLHLAHHFGVVANPGMKRELPTVCLAQPDWCHQFAIETCGELSHCSERVVCHSQGSSEHIG